MTDNPDRKMTGIPLQLTIGLFQACMDGAEAVNGRSALSTTPAANLVEMARYFLENHPEPEIGAYYRGVLDILECAK